MTTHGDVIGDEGEDDEWSGVLLRWESDWWKVWVCYI